MHRVMGIDIETYSSVDLAKAGVYAYTEAPDFDILLIGYKYDDEGHSRTRPSSRQPSTRTSSGRAWPSGPARPCLRKNGAAR